MNDSTTATMNESDKYRQFRNFMCNELGITRTDIETWTREAIAIEVEKCVGSLASGRIDELVNKEIRKTVSGVGWSVTEALKREVANAVSRYLATRIRVDFITEGEASK